MRKNKIIVVASVFLILMSLVSNMNATATGTFSPTVERKLSSDIMYLDLDVPIEVTLNTSGLEFYKITENIPENMQIEVITKNVIVKANGQIIYNGGGDYVFITDGNPVEFYYYKGKPQLLVYRIGHTKTTTPGSYEIKGLYQTLNDNGTIVASHFWAVWHGHEPI